ncbi:MAG: hypothetical protein Q8L77_01365 [Nitrospirota bacterium]|nr:hypothetical protein [Nitrospirota bacterium]
MTTPRMVVLVALIGGLIATGCARLPYQTTTLYQGQRAAVALQQEVEPARYSHPAQLRADEMASILRGFSIRPQQRLPLRWFAEERPPARLFHEDELLVIAPLLAEGLQKAGPEERVQFSLFAPGQNRSESRTVTSGWVAVCGPYLYLTVEYLHAEVPIRSLDAYYPNNPNLPPLPGAYLLFFEPGRYWVMDRAGARALEFREFLKGAPLVVPRPGQASP